MKPFAPLFFVFVIVCNCPFAVAHGNSNERIHSIDHDIYHQPNNALLFLKRGQVHLDEQHWPLALADFKKAWQLDNTLFESWYWQARVYFGQQQVGKAHHALAQYLHLQPTSAKGALLMAQIFNDQGEYQQAHAFFNQAISNDRNPLPQVFIDRANNLAQMDSGTFTEIEQGLHQALAIQPNNVALIDALVDIATESGLFAEALAALQFLPQLLQNSPLWLLKKAELEHLNGQPQRAASAYEATIAAVHALPHQREQLPKFKAIKAKAQAQLLQLQQSGSVRH